MQMYKHGLLTLGLLSAAVSQAFAQPVVIFGDSLSDIGQYDWHSPATFKTQDKKPNLLWSQHFSNALGYELKASSQGGTNYAYSGGVINANDADAKDVKDKPNLVVGTQVENYLNAGVKPDAVHVLFVGGNDMEAILKQAATADKATAKALLMNSVQENAKLYAKAWGALRQQGIDTVIVPDVPNVMNTPSGFKAFVEAALKQVGPKMGLSSEQVTGSLPKMLKTLNDAGLTNQDEARKAWLKEAVTAMLTKLGKADAVNLVLPAVLSQYDETMNTATQATSFMNMAMTEALNQVGGNIVRLPLQAMFDDIVANAKAYGLDNAAGQVCSNATAQTGPCYPYGDSPTDSDLTGNSPTPESFVFADSFHPGPKVHKILSDWMLSTLAAPSRLSIVGQGMQLNAEAAVNTLVNQNTRWVGSSLASQGSQAFVSVGASQFSMVPSVYAGGAFNVAPTWQASLLMGHQSSNPKKDGVNVKLHAYTFSGALRHDMGNLWVGGYAQAAAHHGVETRTETLAGIDHQRQANVSAYSLSAGVFGGWKTVVGPMDLIVTGRLGATKGAVAGFQEQYLGLARQGFTRVDAELGTEAQYHMGAWTPSVELRWRQNLLQKNDKLTVLMNGSQFGVDAPKWGRSRLETALGLGYEAPHQPWSARLDVRKAWLTKGIDDSVSVNFNLGYKF